MIITSHKEAFSKLILKDDTQKLKYEIRTILFIFSKFSFEPTIWKLSLGQALGIIFSKV